MDAMHVGAVVLAAGESRRFGSPKQLALLEGRTLLEHVLELADRAHLRPVVAVVPVWLTRPAALASPDLRWIRNANPELGMSHSLQLGFAALPDRVEAAVILLGDEPTIPVDHLAALLDQRGERPFVATRRGRLLAPPALVERSHFPVVSAAAGDLGLREVLRANPDLVVPIDAPGPIPDIDTPDDLGRMREP